MTMIMKSMITAKRASATNMVDIAPETSGKKIRRTERPVQISWKNVTIDAIPPKGKCKPKNALKEPKPIIRGVSGTV